MNDDINNNIKIIYYKLIVMCKKTQYILYSV